jgi:hypothetical protein
MKNWFTKLAVIAGMVVLGGCATEPTYDEQLQDWVGAEESLLIKTWGPPDATYELDGVRYVSYNRSDIFHLPGTPDTVTETKYGNYTYKQVWKGQPSITQALNCKTTFKVVSKRIASWEYKGNHCPPR